MNMIEEKLHLHKQTVNSVQAPQELESRLRDALQKVPTKKRKVNRAKVGVASAAAALLLFTGMYQYPALAYYGSKLFNREELSSMDFSALAQDGYGQKVDKSIALDDGTVITVDGVISDDNAFLMYYTINRDSDSIYDEHGSHRYHPLLLKGFMTNSNPNHGSGGLTGEDERKYQGVYRFDPVSPFSKTLTVTFREWLDSGKPAEHSITFDFEANKAMKSIIKENISQSVKVDQGTIHFESITASPTSTIVKGYYDMKYEGGPRYPGKVTLYVNDMELISWGMFSNINDKTGNLDFTYEFDVLPTDQIKDLHLVLQSFSDRYKVEKPISLSNPSDRSIKVGPEKLWIRSVNRTARGYDIVIASKEFVHLDKENLSVKAGGTIVPVAKISSKQAWDLKNGNILWEQTYSFNTKEKPEQLLLDGFHYIKTYNHKIPIPVDKK